MDYLASTSLKELKAMYKREKDGSVKMRLLMVMHRKFGKDFRSIGAMLMVSTGKVHYWVERFRAGGLVDLSRKTDNMRRNNCLTKEQESMLRDLLKKQPMTSREVRAYISDNFGRTYHPNSMPRLLRRLGQSLITPRPRNYRANPRSGHAFKGHIKKVVFVEI